jgi:hypothetical protein
VENFWSLQRKDWKRGVRGVKTKKKIRKKKKKEAVFVCREAEPSVFSWSGIKTTGM